MSEWYENQKKPDASFLKSIRKRINEKPAKREDFTKEEHKRWGKLNGMLDQLRRGKNVQNHQLQKWPSEGDYAQIETE